VGCPACKTTVSSSVLDDTCVRLPARASSPGEPHMYFVACIQPPSRLSVQLSSLIPTRIILLTSTRPNRDLHLHLDLVYHLVRCDLVLQPPVVSLTGCGLKSARPRRLIKHEVGATNFIFYKDSVWNLPNISALSSREGPGTHRRIPVLISAHRVLKPRAVLSYDYASLVA
jgi:hypothetical protein